MPKLKNGGWLLDDSQQGKYDVESEFTPEQLAEIQALIKAGKQDEANKLIEKILAEKNG